MSHIEFVDDILVYNSVSAVSGLFADTLEIRSSISSPDFDQVKSVSSTWDSTYLTVSSLSAAWNIDYDGSDIKALTGNWESTYVVTSALSSDWTTAFNTVCAWGSSSVPDIALRFSADIIGNGIDNTYTYFHGLGTKDLIVSIIEIATGNVALAAVYVTDTTITVEFAEVLSDTLYRLVAIGATNLADYASISANWQSTFSTVSGNSGDWGYQGVDLKNLSGNWESTYTTFRDQSANFLTAETDSQTLTFDDGTKELSISNGNNVSLSALDVTALSSNWQNTYNTVSSNSASWSYDGSDLRGLTANYDSAYTTVSSNSAQWAYDGSDLKALSSNWQNTYSTVSSNSASWSGNPQVIEATVFNADTVALTRGNVVYSFGATGSTMSVKLASNSGESTSSKSLGFVNGTIAPGETGLVTIAGRMENLNFGSPFVDGDALWLGTTPGTYTRVKPTAPNHGVYLGVVERANSGNGIAYIKVQNGYELNEIHDVLITSPLSGQMLRRNSANTLWTNTDDGTKWDNTYSTVNSTSGLWSAARVFGSEYSFHEQFLNTVSLAGNLNLGVSTGASLTLATSGIFGMATISTGTNATAASNARLTTGGSQFTIPGVGSLDYVIRFGQSSATWFDGTLTGAFRAGLMTSFNVDSNGMYFRSANGTSLEFVSRNGGSESTIPLGNLSQGVLHLCQFSLNSAGTSITVKYNGSQVGVITTNIPSSSLFHNICIIRDSATGTAVTANLDFVAMRFVPNTPFFVF